jgi:phage-related protein
MTDEQLLAYEGEKFTIEWYRDEKGNSQSLEYFMELNEASQDKLFLLFKRMAEFGRISDKTKFRHEDDQIYAFKPKPDRFLCFFQKGRKIIVTNAFMKKQDKLPKNEKKRAMEYREDYLLRTNKGRYYED